ncbi:hypothetical protein IWX90DRAFT_137052 [Phyllosticta citrichinensis]|uniref:Uncharacterized protein n=1 Tax=Phyllosticta citrichinensis TaxID=1130410 RepID=A0ABR1XY93_9PEZI
MRTDRLWWCCCCCWCLSSCKRTAEEQGRRVRLSHLLLSFFLSSFLSLCLLAANFTRNMATSVRQPSQFIIPIALTMLTGSSLHPSIVTFNQDIAVARSPLSPTTGQQRCTLYIHCPVQPSAVSLLLLLFPQGLSLYLHLFSHPFSSTFHHPPFSFFPSASSLSPQTNILLQPYSCTHLQRNNLAFALPVNPVNPTFPLSLFPSSLFPSSLFPSSLFPSSLFPLPSFFLPSFPLPSFFLPSFPLPSFPLPSFPLPSFPLPSFPLPSFFLCSFAQQWLLWPSSIIPVPISTLSLSQHEIKTLSVAVCQISFHPFSRKQLSLPRSQPASQPICHSTPTVAAPARASVRHQRTNDGRIEIEARRVESSRVRRHFCCPSARSPACHAHGILRAQSTSIAV